MTVNLTVGGETAQQMVARIALRREELELVAHLAPILGTNAAR